MNATPLVSDAAQDLIHAVARYAVPVPCGHDRILFLQGDEPIGVYLLWSGRAALSMTSIFGKEVLRVNVPPGSILGLPGVISEKPYSLTAVAESGAEVGFVSGDHFNAALYADPSLASKVLQLLAAEVQNARKAIFDCHFDA